VMIECSRHLHNCTSRPLVKEPIKLGVNFERGRLPGHANPALREQSGLLEICCTCLSLADLGAVLIRYDPGHGSGSKPISGVAR
jgi:hypothetical protein